MEKIGLANIKGIDYIVVETDDKHILYLPCIIDKENKIEEIMKKIKEKQGD